jgi:hypothetical protein
MAAGEPVGGPKTARFEGGDPRLPRGLGVAAAGEGSYTAVVAIDAGDSNVGCCCCCW